MRRDYEQPKKAQDGKFVSQGARTSALRTETQDRVQGHQQATASGSEGVRAGRRGNFEQGIALWSALAHGQGLSSRDPSPRTRVKSTTMKPRFDGGFLI
ncbi:hypothetical protein A3C67_02385 [Candidatus Nomurabacteria bacterium RIFCSPHIGHO2_02_FULL_42_19]|uniref:Uncharacterized protein n=1 Tax=Candidatus Nomurabacteria bacterium RIFCSPHIGHO2_02_FULL_42_19 TaxID=1801756 RepID=A0A1F6W418_9BACT|nr:MAG: hypothetical protein A3C67_02385 [Candidatus Nomurabacteria bacterium RIFCSPHIGHO2_02_FULL_42_19]